MSAKLKFGFLCDGAMQVQGKWTYQGVFSEIRALSFPATHAEAAMVFQFSGPVGAHMLRVLFAGTDGKPVIPEIRQPIEVQEFKDSHVVINLKGLPIPAEGFFSFNMYLDEDPTPFGAIDLHAIGLEPRPPGKNPQGG